MQIRNWKMSVTTRVLPFSLLLTLLVGGCVTTEPEQRPGLSNDPSVNLMRIARSAESKGDLSSATALYQQAAVLSPATPAPALAMAGTLRAQSRLEEAADIYRQVLGMDGRNVEAHRGLGMTLVSLDKARPALDSFNAALQIDTRDAKSWNGRGIALDLLGRHAEAQHAYRTGLSLNRDDVALNYNLGLSVNMGGDTATTPAVAAPNSGAPRPNLAQAESQQGGVSPAAQPSSGRAWTASTIPVR